ncbi:hypothetical protein Bbelb_291990 [Branchiostoma belcheri]|nr:hypothetical protein Bbelb_291990 [Branchiostoma belcheri]
MTVDYMYGTLLGITKGLMSLWFKSDRKVEYYCGHHLQEIDNILLGLRPPPLDIHRTPGGIQDHLQHWKDMMFPNIGVLLKIACTLPVTSCECERSASALRRPNNHMPTSIGKTRLGPGREGGGGVWELVMVYVSASLEIPNKDYGTWPEGRTGR